MLFFYRETTIESNQFLNYQHWYLYFKFNQTKILREPYCEEGIAMHGGHAYSSFNMCCLGCVDSHLNEDKYIVPGLGDYGDRYYGTE